MKLKMLLSMMLLGMFIPVAQASAQQHEILSVEQVSETELSISMLTPYYCNNPLVQMEYQHSGRARFGPHFYGVIVTATNRAICHGKGEIEVIVAIPEDRMVDDHLVIVDDKTSTHYIVIE